MSMESLFWSKLFNNSLAMDAATNRVKMHSKKGNEVITVCWQTAFIGVCTFGPMWSIITSSFRVKANL